MGGAEDDPLRKRLEEVRIGLEAENAAALAQVAAARATCLVKDRRIEELEEVVRNAENDRLLAPILETALELANADAASAKRERDGIKKEAAKLEVGHGNQQ